MFRAVLGAAFQGRRSGLLLRAAVQSSLGKLRKKGHSVFRAFFHPPKTESIDEGSRAAVEGIRIVVVGIIIDVSESSGATRKCLKS